MQMADKTRKKTMGGGAEKRQGRCTAPPLSYLFVKQLTEYSLIYRKSSAVTGSLRERDLVGYIFPRLAVVAAADSTILMVTIFIKIDIKVVTHEKRCRTLTPIVACNGRGHLYRESVLYPRNACHPQVLLRRKRIFILHHHYQILHLRIAHNSCINHAEVGIEKQLGFGEVLLHIRIFFLQILRDVRQDHQDLQSHHARIHLSLASSRGPPYYRRYSNGR